LFKLPAATTPSVELGELLEELLEVERGRVALNVVVVEEEDEVGSSDEDEDEAVVVVELVELWDVDEGVDEVAAADVEEVREGLEDEDWDVVVELEL